MRDFDVVVVGELNADLMLSGDVMPAFGQVEKLVSDAALTIGSSSAIFACGAARLGLLVTFIGKVGDDEFGHFMLRELNARGIDTTGIVVDPHVKTGLSIILSQGSDRAILTYAGSIAALRYDEIDSSILARARHLHLGSYFLLTALRPSVPALFDMARAHGLTISLDTNYDPHRQWNGGLSAALQRVHVFLPNETELLAITFQSSLESALSHLAFIPTIAVKRGERGATARRGVEMVHADSLSVNVVDTTGAGDSFDAGFIYGFLAGWELSRTVHFACVCGSLSTRVAGGTAAQATLDEALQAMTAQTG